MFIATWPYRLCLVIGSITALFAASSLASILMNPPTLPIVFYASIASNIATIFFGAILIAPYIHSRDNELVGIQPNTPQDSSRLSRLRDWIFALLIVYLMAGSINIWIVNDYMAGLTINNLMVIIDLLLNIALFYVV